jgi:YidC/Oxa1 family membrane protein insertase
VYQAVIRLTQVSVAEHAVGKMIGVLSGSGVNVANLTALNLSEPRLYGSFLWLPNLGLPDPFYILGVHSVVFQLVVQLMATPRVQDPQQKAMTQSMLIMPFLFGYLGFTFPSGAVLYWVVGSILSMIQQYVISGWGSLANYLKFLPTTGGLLPPTVPAIAGSSVGNGAAVVEEQPAQKLSFWDVLSPLMEQEKRGEATASQGDDSTEQAVVEGRRQTDPANARRRRARR